MNETRETSIRSTPQDSLSYALSYVGERDITFLGAWEEVYGTYRGFKEDEDYLLVEISSTTVVKIPSQPEIVKKLKEKRVGDRIGVLITDNALVFIR